MDRHEQVLKTVGEGLALLFGKCGIGMWLVGVWVGELSEIGEWSRRREEPRNREHRRRW
jgi:hypothetical protein